MRAFWFYDPAPTLRRLQTPTLALFGELDHNIVAEKNKTAWDAALKTAGNPDHTLSILPNAIHGLFQGKVGNNAEELVSPGLVPAYFTTTRDWLATRVRGFN
jgi:hypothetical protein